MSQKAIEWAMDYAPVKRGKDATRNRLVLTFLARRYNDEHRAVWWPIPRIAESLDLSERTVQRALADLEAQGLIFRTDQSQTAQYTPGRRPTVWGLNLRKRRPKPSKATTPTDTVDDFMTATDDYYDVEVEAEAAAQNENPQVERGDKVVTRGVTVQTPRGDNVVTQKETKTKVKKKEGGGVVPTTDEVVYDAEIINDAPPAISQNLPTYDDHCDKHRHVEVPPPCGQCKETRLAHERAAKERTTNMWNMLAAASAEEKRKDDQRYAGIHDCDICDTAGNRTGLNTRTGLSMTVKCWHTDDDAVDRDAALEGDRDANLRATLSPAQYAEAIRSRGLDEGKQVASRETRQQAMSQYRRRSDRLAQERADKEQEPSTGLVSTALGW